MQFAQFPDGHPKACATREASQNCASWVPVLYRSCAERLNLLLDLLGLSHNNRKYLHYTFRSTQAPLSVMIRHQPSFLAMIDSASQRQLETRSTVDSWDIYCTLDECSNRRSERLESEGAQGLHEHNPGHAQFLRHLCLPWTPLDDLSFVQDPALPYSHNERGTPVQPSIHGLTNDWTLQYTSLCSPDIEFRTVTWNSIASSSDWSGFAPELDLTIPELEPSEIKGRATSSCSSITPQCLSCGAMFRGRYGTSNLTRHMKYKHSVVRRLRCLASGCNKTYKRQDARLKHVRKHHPGLEVQRDSGTMLMHGHSK